MAKFDKNSDILFKFWEDPKNEDLIVNAVPLEILTFEELVRDHFDQKMVSSLPSDPSPTELKIWEILNSKPSESDKPAMEAIKPFEVKSLKPAVPEPTSLSDMVLETGAPCSPEVPDQIKSESEVVIPTAWTRRGDSFVYEPSENFKILEEMQLDHFHFKCVGNLFWFKYPRPRDETGKVIYFSTAFYVGNKKIVTAAHAFDLGGASSRNCLRYPQSPEHEAIFVPAMSTKYDYLGRRFGAYSITNLKKIKGYQIDTPDLKNRQYDICSAEIHSGKKNGTAVDIDDELTQERISLLPHHKEHEVVSAIGYAWCPRNKDQRMCTIQNKLGLALDKNIVFLNEGLPYGMSGGPWMGTQGAHGIQSATLKSGKYSFSPYITSDIIEELDITEVLDITEELDVI